MTMKFVLTLALCLLSLSGTIFASSGIRFTLPVNAQVNGVSLAPGDYILRQLDLAGDSTVVLIYSSDGKTHKATVNTRMEESPLNAPAALNFDRVNGGLELTTIQAEGRLFRVVK